MEDNRESIQTTSFINLCLGIWLIVSPWILNYVSGAKWNQLVLGIVVTVLSLFRMVAPSQSWASFFNGLAGIWLIIAPFAIGYNESTAYWNEILVGIVVAWLAFMNSTFNIHHPTGGRHIRGTA